MRAVIFSGVIGLLILLGYILFRLCFRTSSPGPWQPSHKTIDNYTIVSVEKRGSNGKVIDSQPVDKIPVYAVDYDMRFLEAMSRARNRASVLQSELELPSR